MKNKFVSYLNTLHNASGCNEHSIAENNTGDADEFHNKLQFERAITKQLVANIEQEKGNIIILTGHAGDGKTSILQDIYEYFTGTKMDGRKLKGIITLFDQSKLYYVKDMSEHAREEQLQIMKDAFAAQKQNESTIIISNTGPLFNVLQELGAVERDIIQMLDTKELNRDYYDFSEEREVSILVANLALFDNSDIIEKYIDKILNRELWESCEKCDKKAFCPIYFNQNIVRKNKEQIIQFSQMFYRWNFEHEERFTVRQMIAHITYSFTGNLNCAGIKELKGKRDLKRKLYNSYSNLFFGYHYEKEFSKADKNALQIKPIRLLQQQKLDAKKIEQEYQLFVKNDFTAFQTEVEELVELCLKSSSYSREEKEELQIQECYKVIKRAYYMYHIKGKSENEKLRRSVFNSMFEWFMKIQEMLAVSNELRDKVKNVTFQALHKIFTGIMSDDETKCIYLTVKRRGDVSQNVQVYQGQIYKNDMKIDTKLVRNIINGKEERKVLLKCKSEQIELTLPILEYFWDISNGLIQSKVEPRLSQGVENIKAKIYRAGRKLEDEDGIGFVYYDGDQFKQIFVKIEEDGSSIYVEE